MVKVLNVSQNITFNGRKARIVLINDVTERLRVEEERETIAVNKSETQVTLIVEDQGRGISQEDQKRIFMRFERAVSGTEISGLGLGLTIIKEILDAHQGHISVQSKPGEGSKFIVELPLHLT